jgi:hypothetical protein
MVLVADPAPTQANDRSIVGFKNFLEAMRIHEIILVCSKQA